MRKHVCAHQDDFYICRLPGASDSICGSQPRGLKEVCPIVLPRIAWIKASSMSVASNGARNTSAAPQARGFQLLIGDPEGKQEDELGFRKHFDR